jgi:hypothetical protein
LQQETQENGISMAAQSSSATAQKDTRLITKSLDTQLVSQQPAAFASDALEASTGDQLPQGAANISDEVPQPDDICFVSSTSTMRRVFTLPFSAGPVSLVLHRMGDMLVMEGMLEAMDANSSQKPSQKPADANLEANYLYYSTQTDEDLIGSDPSTEGRLHVDLQGQGSHAPGDRLGSGPKVHGSGGREKRGDRSTGSRSSRAVDPMPAEDSAFKQSFHCNIGEYETLLGSDLIVFANEAHPAFSMQLVNVNREVPSMACLELWLENVFQSIPETGICCHNDGFVQGYKLMRTDELPALDSKRKFQPAAVMQSGSSILKFLHSNCKKDNVTYWLHRDAGGSRIQLYEVEPKTYSEATRLASSVATLCFRMAEKFGADGDERVQQRRLRLYARCVQLLEEQQGAFCVGDPLLVLLATAKERLASLELSHVPTADELTVLAAHSITKTTENLDGAMDWEQHAGSFAYSDLGATIAGLHKVLAANAEIEALASPQTAASEDTDMHSDESDDEMDEIDEIRFSSSPRTPEKEARAGGSSDNNPDSKILALQSRVRLQAARVMMAIGLWSLKFGSPALALTGDDRRDDSLSAAQRSDGENGEPVPVVPGDVGCALHHLLLASWWLNFLPGEPTVTQGRQHCVALITLSASTFVSLATSRNADSSKDIMAGLRGERFSAGRLCGMDATAVNLAVEGAGWLATTGIHTLALAPAVDAEQNFNRGIQLLFRALRLCSPGSQGDADAKARKTGAKSRTTTPQKNDARAKEQAGNKQTMTAIVPSSPSSAIQGSSQPKRVPTDDVASELSRALGDVYKSLGEHYIATGRTTKAHRHFQQGISLFQAVQINSVSSGYNLGRPSVAMCMCNIGRIVNDSKVVSSDYESSVAAYTSSIDWFRKAKHALKPVTTAAAATAAGAAAQTAWWSIHLELADTQMSLALLLMRGLPTLSTTRSAGSREKDTEREVVNYFGEAILWYKQIVAARRGWAVTSKLAAAHHQLGLFHSHQAVAMLDNETARDKNLPLRTHAEQAERQLGLALEVYSSPALAEASHGAAAAAAAKVRMDLAEFLQRLTADADRGGRRRRHRLELALGHVLAAVAAFGLQPAALLAAEPALAAWCVQSSSVQFRTV